MKAVKMRNAMNKEATLLMLQKEHWMWNFGRDEWVVKLNKKCAEEKRVQQHEDEHGEKMNMMTNSMKKEISVMRRRVWRKNSMEEKEDSVMRDDETAEQ